MGTKKKGGKTRKRGKNKSDYISRRDLVLKEEGQEYAKVLKMLGNGRLEAYCYDGHKRLCRIRGNMRKKVWINIQDVVLIALREFEKDKADVIHKYNADEARDLKKLGEIQDFEEESTMAFEIPEVDGEDGEKEPEIDLDELI